MTPRHWMIIQRLNSSMFDEPRHVRETRYRGLNAPLRSIDDALQEIMQQRLTARKAA